MENVLKLSDFQLSLYGQAVYWITVILLQVQGKFAVQLLGILAFNKCISALIGCFQDLNLFMIY